MIPAAAIVKRPELVIVTGPKAVVVTVLLMLKIVPLRSIPATAFVFKAPLKVVVPVPPAGK